jgi:hypothetical protein
MRAGKRFGLVMRLTLAAMFSYAATGKVRNFAAGERVPTIFGEWAPSAPVRGIVIGAEALLAVWLMSGIKKNVAGAVALTLLSAFTGLVLMELRTDHPKPCGCMGPQAQVSAALVRTLLRLDLLRNVFMMAAAAWLYLLPQSSQTQGHGQRGVSIIVARLFQREVGKPI